MIRIDDQISVGKFLILHIDAPIPMVKYSKVLIDGKEYAPEIVYDMKNSIAIHSTQNLKGKEIKFIA